MCWNYCVNAQCWSMAFDSAILLQTPWQIMDRKIFYTLVIWQLLPFELLFFEHLTFGEMRAYGTIIKYALYSSSKDAKNTFFSPHSKSFFEWSKCWSTRGCERWFVVFGYNWGILYSFWILRSWEIWKYKLGNRELMSMREIRIRTKNRLKNRQN